MRELNEFSCISEGGMIRERIKQNLSKVLAEYDISCSLNSQYLTEEVTRINCDVIGDNFLIEIGRWEYWEKSLSDLLYKNAIVQMRFKVLIVYLRECIYTANSLERLHQSQNLETCKSKYNYSQAPALKAIKQAAKLQGVSVLNATEQDYIKLAESISKKIPSAKC